MSPKLIARPVVSNLLRRRALLLGALAVAAAPAPLSAQSVSFAGVQTTVPATGLSLPVGVAVDGAGDVFVADTANSRVVEVNRSTPPSLSFAATNIGSTSSDSPQSVTVQDIGNQTLSGIAPGLTIGANFTQEAGTGTPADCTASLALNPGASCNLSISFTPTAARPISSAATLTDNSLNGKPATQNISLSGTGVLLTQIITFTPIGTQMQGGTVTLSATSNSGLTVSFTSLTPTVCTVSGSTASLIAPGTCTIAANQAGSTQYAAAPQVTRSFAVTPAFTLTVTPRHSRRRLRQPLQSCSRWPL